MELQQARLCLLGHCLCMPCDTVCTVDPGCICQSIPKGRQGRPPKCLLITLRTDVEEVGLILRNAKGLEELRRLAADKDQWEQTIEHIFSA